MFEWVGTTETLVILTIIVLSLVLAVLVLRDIIEYFQLEDAEPKKHALTPEEEAKRLKEEAK